MKYHIFAKVADPFVQTEIEANSQEDALATYYNDNPGAAKTAYAELKQF